MNITFDRLIYLFNHPDILAHILRALVEPSMLLAIIVCAIGFVRSRA